MTIIDKLNELGDAVMDDVDNLNSGGCGIFAAMVAKSLIDKGIPTSLFSCWDEIWDGQGGNIDLARPLVKDVGEYQDWRENGIRNAHVGVEFEFDGKLYHYDSSEGVHEARNWLSRESWIVNDGRYTLAEMEALNERPHNWNSRFDRKQIPKIQHYVEEYLNG